MSVVTAADVEKASNVLVVAPNDVVTPLARDRAKELGIRLERSGEVANVSSAAGRTRVSANGVPANGVSAGAVRSDRPKNTLGQSIALAGALPAAPRPASLQNAVQHSPRSGALYRRGGYGLQGQRSVDAGTVREALAAHTRPSVAIVGAGHVGAAAGIRLAESNAFERLTLVDVVDGLAAGLALDMWHGAALRGFTTKISGSSDLAALQGADVVVVTAGLPRKPGMTRTDLTQANASIVRGVAAVVRERAPGAVVLVVTNPVEEMTHLMRLATGFPEQRVIGMGGVLDTARFCALVGLSGVAKPEDVRAIVLGSHGAEMVIPLSQATANGVPLETLLDATALASIVQRTRDSGAEVTGLLKAGSAYVSPGAAIARQVEAIVRGSDEVLPACVASGGAYGIRDVRIGLPVRLGLAGVREIVSLELRPGELRELRAAAEAIRARTQTVARA